MYDPMLYPSILATGTLYILGYVNTRSRSVICIISTYGISIYNFFFMRFGGSNKENIFVGKFVTINI